MFEYMTASESYIVLFTRCAAPPPGGCGSKHRRSLTKGQQVVDAGRWEELGEVRAAAPTVRGRKRRGRAASSVGPTLRRLRAVARDASATCCITGRPRRIIATGVQRAWSDRSHLVVERLNCSVSKFAATSRVFLPRHHLRCDGSGTSTVLVPLVAP